MKKYILAFSLSFVLYMLVMPLRGGYITVLGLTGFPLSMLVGFILYLFLTLFLFYKLDGKAKITGILLSILLGCVILEIPVRIIGFKSSLVSLPDIVFKVMAILMAYIVYIVRGRLYKIIISIIAFTLCIWMSYDGYDRWLHMLNHGTFNGKIEQVVNAPVVFQDSEGNDIPVGDFKGKYLVLDFWSSTCGICFKKFPLVQKFYDETKDNPDVELYAVFCRMPSRNEGLKTGGDVLREEGYSFPTVSMDMDDPVLKEMGVDGFPTVLVFDPSGKIVFRGDIQMAKQYLEKCI